MKKTDIQKRCLLIVSSRLFPDVNSSLGFHALEPQLPYSIYLFEVGCRQYDGTEEMWITGDCQVGLEHNTLYMYEQITTKKGESIER